MIRSSVILPFTILVALGAGEPVQNRAPLQPNALVQLPLTSVKPKGWLLNQLRTQAHGLSGHLDEFWPDLRDSAWLGKSGEGWERGPYYTDGLVPLAYLLDDPDLIAKANRWVAWTLDHQRKDGGIGPEKNKDWWPNMIYLKALTQYAEATGDARVLPFMQRYFHYQLEKMNDEPLKSWAAYRWQDEVLSVIWAYNRSGDPKLLELVQLLHKQGHDWKGQFANFPYKDKVNKDQLTLDTHVVNNAMALKTSPVWWVITGDKSDRDGTYHQLSELDRYHLLPSGVHSGDEHYAGRNPTQGTELCAVVEAMFSLEEMLAILGDPALGDREEKIAFNALPGAFSGDMWAHQYDQQSNQVKASVEPRPWTNNKPDSNVFGLEPNFGCCTANYHQGLPKFTANLWMAAPDHGLAAAFYAPSEVRTVVGNGVKITITEDTGYPFRDTIQLAVQPEKTVAFPLLLRIPAWAESPVITVNGAAVSGAKAGSFFTLSRTWNPGDRVALKFPMNVRAGRWYHDSVALERGPLVYSLKIGEEWKKIRDLDPAADWEVDPTTDWNYALQINAKNPGKSVQVVEKPIGNLPFTPAGAPVELHVKGRKLPDWKLDGGNAGSLPQSPVRSRQPLENLTLIPYGSAKLRITEFPVLR